MSALTRSGPTAAPSGGPTPKHRNLISGRNTAVRLNNNRNIVQGNFLGTEVTGTSVLGPNVGGGVVVGSSDNLIGGTAGTTLGGACTGVCNVISVGWSAGVSVGGQRNIVQRNVTGTDVTGTVTLGNTRGLGVGGVDKVIAENVISASAPATFLLGGKGFGVSATGRNTLVIGNKVGTDTTGTVALGNGGPGIDVHRSNNTIKNNVVAASASTGVQVLGADNLLQGNLIGTDYTGTTSTDAFGSSFGNSRSGLRVSGSNNTIGGTAPGAGNVIAYNAGDGVFVPQTRLGPGFAGKGNAILSNSIHSNGSLTVSDKHLGIDLGGSGGRDGVNANDIGDEDSGGNRNQNYPVLDSATSISGITTVVGTLNSTPDTDFRIECFANSVLDPCGHTARVRSFSARRK